jgi:UPF0755 protein
MWQRHLIATVSSIVLTCSLLIAWNVYRIANHPMVTSTTPVMIHLDKSTSAWQFTHLLKERGFIHSTKLFLLMIRLKGVAHQLKAGMYQIKPGETPLQLLDRVVSGDVVMQHFLVVAGTTQYSISERLLHTSDLDYHPEDWLSIQDHHQNAEGLLLADTYQYPWGARSITLLNMAHKHLLDYLNTSWMNRSADLPYHNAYELLIAASIIEKETAAPKERALISGVMVNRLKKNMPLQMDPTVIYGLGAQYTGKLSHQDMAIESPYNSYRYRGLPPTPIAMVGKESIDAAAHPASSAYLYFVAKGDGTHQFSETYEQQKQAISRYRK